MKQGKEYRAPLGRTSGWATLVLVGLAVLFVYPFVWMLLAGFKSNREIFQPFEFWPDHWDPTYYRQLFRGDWIPFFRVFANSMVVALVQAIGVVALTAPAGYVFARRRFAGRRTLFVVSLVVIVMPPQALAVPLFSWLHTLRLDDHLIGVILPGLANGLGIIYFTQVFRQVPDELVDAARLAGASEFRVFLTLMPLLSSALLSFGLIAFILAWHEHLLPMLVLSSRNRQTLPLALSSLYGSSLRYPYGVLMAASTLTVAPAVALFALLYRRFRSALADLLVH